jgi:hypothetical protein
MSADPWHATYISFVDLLSKIHRDVHGVFASKGTVDHDGADCIIIESLAVSPWRLLFV